MMMRAMGNIVGVCGLVSVLWSAPVLSAPITQSEDLYLTLASAAEGEEGRPLEQSVKEERQPQPALKKATLSHGSRPVKLSGDRQALWQEMNAHSDFWIYDTRLTLIRDLDHDGYYSGFSLDIDADTYYSLARVYVRLYLQQGNALYEYHESDPFYLRGESEDDSLRVETNLIEGFSPYDYNLVVELLSAETHELLAVRTQFDDSDLTLVPLESRDYEVKQQKRVVLNREGGSVFWLLWFGVCVAVMRFYTGIRGFMS